MRMYQQRTNPENKAGNTYKKQGTARKTNTNRVHPSQLKEREPRGHDLIQRKNNTGIPDRLKSGMENLTGMNLDHIRVHYNSPKPALVQACAYAQGNKIHLASGQKQHLSHELGHVVQQMQGKVKPTTKVNGMAINNNPRLEKEADAMGMKAMRM